MHAVGIVPKATTRHSLLDDACFIFSVGFVDLAQDAGSRLHGTTGQPKYEAAVPSDPFPQADAGKVRD